jgi:glycerophosphoryl diester phosphodiesterase
MKFKYQITILFILALIGFGIYLYVEPPYTLAATPASEHHHRFPKIIAHKSMVSDKYVANSLKAIQNALASNIDGIKIDVRLAKDKIPFLYHGDMLEDATNGQGIPEALTWEQLKKIYYIEDKTSKLVKLEEVFNIVGSQKYIFLYVKNSDIFNAEISKIIYNLIANYHLENTVVVESLNPFFLTSMRFISQDVQLMYDFITNAQTIDEEMQSQTNKLPWILKQPFVQKQIRRIMCPDILGPRWNIEQELIKSLVDHGYTIVTWTVNEAELAQKMFALGVKGVQTNYPLMLEHHMEIK